MHVTHGLMTLTKTKVFIFIFVRIYNEGMVVVVVEDMISNQMIYIIPNVIICGRKPLALHWKSLTYLAHRRWWVIIINHRIIKSGHTTPHSLPIQNLIIVCSFSLFDLFFVCSSSRGRCKNFPKGECLILLSTVKLLVLVVLVSLC